MKAEDERWAAGSVSLAALEQGPRGIVGAGHSDHAVRDANDVARRDGRAQFAPCDACLKGILHTDQTGTCESEKATGGVLRRVGS